MPSPVPVRSKVDVAPVSWGVACEEMLAGRRVTRAEWGEAETVVFLHAGVLHLRKADGSLHTLIVSEGDLSATDWLVVREN